MKASRFLGFLCLLVFPQLHVNAANDRASVDSLTDGYGEYSSLDEGRFSAVSPAPGGAAGPGAGGGAAGGGAAGGGAAGGGNNNNNNNTLKGPDWTAVDVEADELPLNDGMSIGGNLDGWNLYTGLYYPELEGKGDTAVYNYVYSWKKATAENAKADQRMMLKSDLGQTDPIIACSDFYVNPDDETVIQVGRNNGYAEGRNKYSGAFAERMRYAFVVNDQTTLFTYKYACVLHVPTNDKHESYQMPAFYVDVKIESPEGKEVTLNCMSFSGNASFNNSLIQNPATCTEAKVEKGNGTSDNQNPEDYVYQPWNTVAYDLSDYIGYTVTVDIITHDCLVTSGGKEIAGSHKAYGYFWGKTQPKELIPRNCGNDDAYITAPKGFENYEWSRVDDHFPLQGNGNVLMIPKDEIIDGARYRCEMTGTNSGCTYISVDTVLSTIVLEPNFDYKDTCDMTVNFFDRSVFERDEIKSYKWDFGDGFFSAEQNPVHEYKEGGDYTVTLTVISSRGCSASFAKNVKVNPKPMMDTEGDQRVCVGDMIVMSCLASGSKEYFWLNQSGDTISKDRNFSEPAVESQTYTAYIVDQFNCQYSKDIYVAVSASPTLFIKGDSAVCYNTPAKFWVWGDADQYVWNSGYEGDTLKFNPQQSTTYCVTGTYTATGCKSSSCVNVVVNPVPEVSITGPDSICAGDLAVLKAEGAAEYFWNNVYAGDSLMINPTETSIYTVVGTDTNGCPGSASYRMVVASSPQMVVFGNHDICDGEQLNIWVEGAQSYKWDDGTVGSAVSRTPSLNTTSYWVEGANGDCKAKLEIPIVVNPIPTVAIYGKNEICAGDSVQLHAQGAESYEWSTGENLSTIVKNLVMNQTFYVKGTSAQNCVSSASFEVKVHQVPSFSLDGPENVCAGSIVNMTATSDDMGCVFQWSNGFVGANCDTYLNETTLFEVVGTDTTFGCKNKREIKVEVIPNPELHVTGVTTVCRGVAVSLSASGASSYEWNDGTVGSSLILQPSSSVNVWVKGTTGGCYTQMEVPITVLPAPYVWIDGETVLCQGDSLVLMAHGADSYVWNALQSGDSYRAKPTLSSSVSVVGANDNGCKTKVEVPFTVSPIPFVRIEGADVVCDNTPVTLHAVGDDLAQFIWSTGESDSVISEPVSGERLFEVKAWNSNGCSSVAQKRVITVMPPVVSYTGETTVCQGESVILLAAGATNYTWKESSEIIREGDKLVFTPSNNSLVTLIGSEGDCSSSMDIYVTVSPMPTLNVIGETQVCKNQNFTLTATGADEYVWSTGDSTASISYSLSTPTTYMVKGRLIDGCYAKKSIKVEVYPDLNVSLREVRKKGCPGAPTEVQMEADGAAYYVWSSEPYNVTISGTSSYELDALIEEPTMVYVVGSDENGCQSTDSMWIRPKDHNDMTYQILPAIIEKEDPTVHFRGFYPKNTEWSWDPGDGSDVLVGDDVVHTYSDIDVATEDSIKVFMRAVTDEGCTYSATSYVYVWKDFWAPNIFSPNGDGLNDEFRFLGGEYIEDFHFIIYNRLGQTVFEGDSIEAKWDGNDLNGHPCPIEVYGWTVDYNSNYKGIGKSGKKRGYVSILK